MIFDIKKKSMGVQKIEREHPVKEDFMEKVGIELGLEIWI